VFSDIFPSSATVLLSFVAIFLELALIAWLLTKRRPIACSLLILNLTLLPRLLQCQVSVSSLLLV